MWSLGSALFTLLTTMNRKTAILLFAAFLSQISVSRANSFKDALSHKYKNQILALRSPFTATDQKFDSAGQPLNARPAGRWLLYGGIYVEN
jgi:hypothetical protein